MWDGDGGGGGKRKRSGGGGHKDCHASSCLLVRIDGAFLEGPLGLESIKWIPTAVQ